MRIYKMRIQKLYRFLERSCDDWYMRNAAIHIVALPRTVNAA